MFWILVAALVVIALIIVTLPLLKVKEFTEISREDQNIVIAKDKLVELKNRLESSDINQDQYDVAKGELENALALDLENKQEQLQNQGGRWLIIVLIIALPLSSAGIYWKLGNPDLLNPQQKLAQLKQETQSLENMSVDQMIALVKKRLKANPEDGEGWYILGRTFMNIQKYKEAVVAYQRAHELVGDQANILLSLADATAMTQDGKMIGKPEQLVNQAIEIDPNNAIGLWLAGLAAEQRNELPSAYALWSRLYPLLSNDAASQNEIGVMLSELKITFPDLPELPFNNAIAPLTVTVSISINDVIRSQLQGNEQVFVYAKAVTGPPMPLAAKKLSVADLPIEVTLSDADAMMPQLTLSSVDAFTLGARVSMSGNPIPQKGDYFVEISPLNKNSVDQTINLTIQTRVE